ncbi:MAG: DUF4157 domain-containing protein [Myxococcota bacterium]|nr:DUF4157 domain-containing protein [Myxococcota bacterium]
MTQDRQHRTATSTLAPAAGDLEPGRASSSALLRKPDHAIPSGLLHGAARDDNGVAAGAEHSVAAASSSCGAPLPEHLMRKFEGSLGVDLGAVRVHTGDASATANDAVGARAYTTGHDIHFGAGQYDPSSTAGEHLLAHEVAHTVQQAGSAQRQQFKLEVSAPHDPLEHEADRAADALIAGAPATVTMGHGVQRKIFREAKDDDTMSAPVFKSGLDLGEWASAVNSLVSGAYTVYDGAKKLREDAHFWQKEKLDIARAMEDIAGGALKAAKGISTVLHATQDLKIPVEGAGKMMTIGKIFTDACRTVKTFSTMAELKAFVANPGDKAKAAAWGKQVGKTFDTVGDLVTGITGVFLPEPSFIGSYFKGLFSAPSNYIAYFQSIMDVYYGKLDEQVGMTDVDMKAVQAPHVKGGTFAGTLAFMFSDAPSGLQQVMGDHYESMGLAKVGFYEGKGKVLGLISQQSNPQNVFDWSRYVKSWTSPTSKS